MFQIFVEYRPRLGLAQIYIPVDSDHRSVSYFVDESDDSIQIRSDGIRLAQFFWPDDKGHIKALEQDQGLCEGSKGLSFRMRVVEDGNFCAKGEFSVIPDPAQTSELLVDVPCFMNDPTKGTHNQKVNMLCSNCKHHLCPSVFEIERLLPLPSSDWRDFSLDWFCGCCDHVKTQSKEGVIKNKQLPITKMEPTRNGDVLYTKTSIFVSGKNFGINNFDDLENSTFLKSAESCSVICNLCSNELGLFHAKTSMIQFWHHSVDVLQASNSSSVPKSNKLSESTFGRLILGLVEEHLNQSVKVCLSCHNHDKELFVWILEPNLCLLTGDSSETGSTDEKCYLKEQDGRVMKVLFDVRESMPDKSDHGMNINHFQMSPMFLDATINLLKQNQKFIDPSKRRDQNFEISFIFC